MKKIGSPYVTNRLVLVANKSVLPVILCLIFYGYPLECHLCGVQY